jgi:TM2 domain-containing membrane protein YozV
MKRVFVLFALVLGLSVMTVEAGNTYKIDDNQVESLFASASEGTMSVMFEEMNMAGATASLTSSSKDPLVAILLDFFLGGFGVHRFYLGTEVMTGIGYILTCGGIFGLVPFVDLIVLAVNWDDISKYVDNPKFFMW